MSHRTLTDGYLASFAPDADDAATAVADTSYRGRTLSRPVFLGAAEHRALMSDLAAIHHAIGELPDRLFAGDPAAFAGALGMSKAQIAAVLRSHGERPTRLARADLYRDESGFRLLEFNFGSTMGGFDNAMLNEVMLARPSVRAFVERHDLGYIDTMAEVVDTVRTECGVPADTRPVMAAVDWPDSFTTLEPRLRKSAEVLRKYGLDTYPCHLGQLRLAERRVWLGKLAVDVVYRLFTLDNVLSEVGAAMTDPLLRAVERGEVAIITPLDSDLYGSKGALALLSDDRYRGHLTESERAAVDRLLPWTRQVRSGPVTVGRRSVDFATYVADRREELLLKPMLGYGGAGIVAGWLTDPGEWRARIDAVTDGPYVVQERVHPVPEVFPGGDANDEVWTIAWSAFLMSSGTGGLWVRGDHAGIVNMSAGASATCCFLERG